MIIEIEPDDPDTARRLVEIQRAAYAVEAERIGFDGIPTRHEAIDDVQRRTDLVWRGATVDGTLVAVIAWAEADDVTHIDRLAVDPSFARRGLGRRLVRVVPSGRPTIVSTGAANTPAVTLYRSEGFRPLDEEEIAPGVMIASFRRDPPPEAPT